MKKLRKPPRKDAGVASNEEARNRAEVLLPGPKPSTAAASSEEAQQQPDGQVGDDEDDDGEEQEIQEPNRHLIQLAKPECARCTQLFPDVVQQKPFNAKVKAEGEKKFAKGVVKLLNQNKVPPCHHTKGNDVCPAREFRIVVGLPVRNYAQRYIGYEAEKDTAGLQQLMAKIGSADPVVQQSFWHEVQEARRSTA